MGQFYPTQRSGYFDEQNKASIWRFRIFTNTFKQSIAQGAISYPYFGKLDEFGC